MDNWPPEVVTGLLNAIYYRKFNDEHAEALIRYYNEVDFDSLKADPSLLLEHAAISFRVMADLESYREGDPINSAYTSDQEIYRLQKLARQLHDFVLDRVRGRHRDMHWIM